MCSPVERLALTSSMSIRGSIERQVRALGQSPNARQAASTPSEFEIPLLLCRHALRSFILAISPAKPLASSSKLPGSGVTPMLKFAEPITSE